MGKEASILVTLRDQYSPGVQAMREANSGFGKSFDEVQRKAKAYESRLDGLIKQQGKLQVELVDAKKALKDAEKAYRETGAAADADALAIAKGKYEALNAVMRETVRASRDTETALRGLEGQSGRMARQGTGSSGGVLSALGQAGAWSMLGDVAGQWAGALVTSMGGGAAGGLFSGALSGAGSGAAIGTVIGGPLGTAIGAGVGALVGLAGGAAQTYTDQDEAFKAYYRQIYETGREAGAESLTSGSATAAQRELDEIAFNRLLGEGTGSRYLSDLRAMAAETPMEYSDLTGMSRALATGFGDSPERMLQLMTAIGDAGSAVGVTAQDMTMMAQAMSRMQGSDKATLEYLNILQERGVNVIGMLADAYGKTQGEIYDMISKGQIRGTRAADIIQAGMESMYGGAMETMAGTFAGLTSTLADAKAELDAARGEGYNAVRSGGLQAEADAYSGPLGDAVSALNRISGKNEAYLENLSEQYTREALGAVLLGQDTTLFDPKQQAELERMSDEYTKASLEYRYGNDEAGLKMESLRREAEGLATAAYESSDAYLTVHETELDLIGAIRENTAALNGWRLDYQTEQELGKGRGSVPVAAETGISDPGERIRTINSHRYAVGLRRVPYNNFPAVLHEGERVLTAAEARTAGQTGGVTITGNTFVVRQESDIDAIAAALLVRLKQASMAGAYG